MPTKAPVKKTRTRAKATRAKAAQGLSSKYGLSTKALSSNFKDYDAVRCRAWEDHFFTLTGHRIAIRRNKVGLFTIDLGGVSENHDRWRFLHLRKAQKARLAGEVHVLPWDKHNKDYAESELLDRLFVLAAFINVKNAAAI